MSEATGTIEFTPMFDNVTIFDATRSTTLCTGFIKKAQFFTTNVTICHYLPLTNYSL